MRAQELNHFDLHGSWHTDRHTTTSPLRRALEGALHTVWLWSRRMQERRELRQILDRDARFFADIGVSQGAVATEARKWFWQA